MINEKLLAYPTSTPFTPEYKFNTVQWTGNATARKIVGVGFQPDLIWIKDVHESSNDNSFRFYDSSRGAKKHLSSDSNAAQVTDSTGDGLDSFDADGFSIGTDDEVNENGHDFIAYCWQVNKGTTSTNSTGSANSTVQANQAGGLSIIKWTGTANTTTTIGHGLGATPELIISKNMDTAATDGWPVYAPSVGNDHTLFLNSSGAKSSTGGTWGSTDPTSTVFTVQDNASNNQNGDEIIAYCWDSIAGKQAFGTYTGSGSQGSPDVDIDFKPDLLVVKRIPASEQWWVGGTDTNSGDHLTKWMPLQSNERLQTDTIHSMNLLSDGFEPYGTSALVNDSGDAYLYMAWKKNIGTNLTAGTMAWLVVAGGASGSSNGGGGGAGGLRTSYGGTSGGGADAEDNITLSSGTIYTLTVGAGGAAQTTYQDRGNAGATSSIAASGLTTISTTGGGGGGSNNTPDGIAGGSGGGAGTTPSGGGHDGGAGTANQGYAGGDTTANGHPYAGAGGGGAGAAAANVSSTPGIGGVGVSVGIVGAHTTYAGGGGGTGGTQGAAGGLGGAGGGGQGGTGSSGEDGNAATANTGGGGGASGDAGDSGAGGSGIIALRLLTSEYSGIVSGSPTVTTAGSDTILKYTGTGKYAHGAFPASGSMSWLVVAGGGAGGYNKAGGGGAGGLRTSYPLSSGGGAANESDISLSSGTYTVTIGAGGTLNSTNKYGNSGGTSSIAKSGMTTISTTGGGGGGAFKNCDVDNSIGNVSDGQSGGSGGGGGYTNQTSPCGNDFVGAGASGTANQGYAGGNSPGTGVNHNYGGGGGGGASAAGSVGVTSGYRGGGAGGAGLAVNITGSSVTYAGGGGGWTEGSGTGTNGGAGGAGGGGKGGHEYGCASNTNQHAEAGTANTGGGGGGAANGADCEDSTDGNGGSGVVILRLLTSQYSGSTSGSPTVTTDGDHTVLKFTGSGSYTHS